MTGQNFVIKKLEIHPALGEGGRRFESYYLDFKLNSLFYRGFLLVILFGLSRIKGVKMVNIIGFF